MRHMFRRRSGMLCVLSLIYILWSPPSHFPSRCTYSLYVYVLCILVKRNRIRHLSLTVENSEDRQSVKLCVLWGGKGNLPLRPKNCIVADPDPKLGNFHQQMLSGFSFLSRLSSYQISNTSVADSDI